jgi:hypothetical protein
MDDKAKALSSLFIFFGGGELKVLFRPAQRILLLVIALILISSAIAFFPISKNYVFIDNETNQPVAYMPVDAADFQIKYIHTIHLSEVLESYELTADDHFRMIELQYEDFSVGMPSNAGEGETFVEKDGKYFIRNMSRELPEFRLFIGDVDADLLFLMGNREIDLKEYLTRGKSYTFRVQRLSPIQLIKGVNIYE